MQRAVHEEIKFMTKERKKYKRAFELEWTFGTTAMVHGLKYNPRKDTFVALLVYSVKTKEGDLEEKEEKILFLLIPCDLVKSIIG
jgi:hypothetical protein